MDPLEQRLKAMRLAEPSAALDRRIEESLLSAGRRAKSGSRGWWLPLAATVALACAAVLLIRPAPPTDPASKGEVPVYHMEADGLMRDMLIGPTDRKDGLPPFVIGAVTP